MIIPAPVMVAGHLSEAPAFDPLSISWLHAYWAEGPEFAALGLSDTDAVASWPDEVTTNDLAQATASARPTFRSSVAALGGRPAVEFDGGDRMDAVTSLNNAQPNTIVVVANTTSVAANRVVFGTDDNSFRHIVAVRSSDYLINSGNSVTGGSGGTGVHLLIATFDATDTLEVDGTLVASGDAGSEALGRPRLGNNPSNTSPYVGHIAFAAIRDGTLTSQEKADLLAWSQSHYGTP